MELKIHLDQHCILGSENPFVAGFCRQTCKTCDIFEFFQTAYTKYMEFKMKWIMKISKMKKSQNLTIISSISSMLDDVTYPLGIGHWTTVSYHANSRKNSFPRMINGTLYVSTVWGSEQFWNLPAWAVLAPRSGESILEEFSHLLIFILPNGSWLFSELC